MSGHLEKRRRAALLAALTCLYALFLLFAGDSLQMWLAGASPGVALLFWLVRLAPLAIFLPGLHRHSPRTAAWLSFVILMYFVHAVTTAFVAEYRFYGIAYSLLCMAVFGALVRYINLARKCGMTLEAGGHGR